MKWKGSAEWQKAFTFSFQSFSQTFSQLNFLYFISVVFLKQAAHCTFQFPWKKFKTIPFSFTTQIICRFYQTNCQMIPEARILLRVDNNICWAVIYDGLQIKFPKILVSLWNLVKIKSSIWNNTLWDFLSWGRMFKSLLSGRRWALKVNHFSFLHDFKLAWTAF